MRHHYNADPGSVSRFSLLCGSKSGYSTLILIRTLLLLKVMQICDHWYEDPPGLHIEPLNLLNVEFNANPNPAFPSNADPDPNQLPKIMQIHADQDTHT